MRVYPPKISSSLHQRKELTDLQKRRIIEARALGKSFTEIGEELHIPRKTVSSFFERFQSRGSEENLPHTGRPRKTSAQFDRHLIHAALANTRVPFTELRDITNSEVSIATIHRRLLEDHIRKWRAAKCALLTEKHAKMRLNWAREHCHWTREDWKRIFWSDKCPVQKDSDAQQVWVFRHQNKCEKFDSENVRGRAKGGGVFQMIWGCFASNKLGPIVFINERVNTNTLLFYAKTSFHLLMLSLQMVQRTLFSNKTMPLLMLLKEHVYGLRMQCASMDLC